MAETDTSSFTPHLDRLLERPDHGFWDWDILEADSLEDAWIGLARFVAWLKARRVEIPACWYLHTDWVAYLTALQLSHRRLSLPWQYFSPEENQAFWTRAYGEWPSLFRSQLNNCKRRHDESFAEPFVSFSDHVAERRASRAERDQSPG